MSSKLPQRPDLDHLRRQAKALLAEVERGDRGALGMLRAYLPAAAGLSGAQVRRMRFRLADAQSAIARHTGFANWPQLGRHVEQLRALEGRWEFDALEVEGIGMPMSMLSGARVLIDGDCFRSEMNGTIYEGVFIIDVEEVPHTIDIQFVSGPEAGNTNYGIFVFEEERLTLCLDMSGKGRPTGFSTAPGGHYALEILHRASGDRPESVQGGASKGLGDVGEKAEFSMDFAYVESATLTKMEGAWRAVKIVQDGQEFPSAMCSEGRRTARKNEIKVTMAGQVMLHCRIRVNEKTDPMQVDYCHLGGPGRDVVQLGIMKWVGEEICTCMASVGAARPTDFTCRRGSGWTLSQWRLAGSEGVGD